MGDGWRQLNVSRIPTNCTTIAQVERLDTVEFPPTAVSTHH